MPELPEVQTIVDRMDVLLPGRLVRAAWLEPDSLYREGSLPIEETIGRSIAGAKRLGKTIVLILVPRGSLVIHLGMTGGLRVHSAGSRTVSLPSGTENSKLDRALHGQLIFEDASTLDYYDSRRFGYVLFSESDNLPKLLGIGPDPFEMKPRDFERMLSGRRAPIKSLLLNQRLLSGLGNIYTDETLYRAKVHPLTAGARVAPRAGWILRASRAVLRSAMRLGGTTIRDYRKVDGSKGGFQRRLAVYGRKGEPCRRCGRRIEKIVVASRGTHFCPRCQPVG